MTEHEARELLQAKLTCLEKENKPIYSEDGCDRKCDECNYCYAQGTIGEQKQALAVAIKALEEVQAYRAIGTVDEFKALKEKQIPKKPIEIKGLIFSLTKDGSEAHEIICECPNCRSRKLKRGFPCKCGQRIDWE